MSMAGKHLGQAGERRACRYLERCGFSYRDRNVVTPFGEIDLVMTDRQVLVFVEVKTRAQRLFGHPAEAITKQKLRHLTAAAAWFVRDTGHAGTWRIDVVALVDLNGRRSVNHLPNVTL